MPKCHFTAKYYDYEIGKKVDFYCDDDPLASGFCIFHDKDYLQDKTNNKKHRTKILKRLKHKINHAISKNEPLLCKPLLCIGFHLPDFSLSDLSISSKEFTKPVYFNGCQFFGKADFSSTKFKGEASFYYANFYGKVDFYQAQFKGEAELSQTQFKGEVSFSAANFQGNADFSGSHFQGEAEFSGSHFQGNIFFFRSHFQGASFSNANFQGQTDFSNANFQGEAFFGEANFQGNASFLGANFQGNASFFSKANFQGEVSFSAANFQGNADFSGSHFQGEAYFNNSEFHDKTYFLGNFNGKTQFNRVLFEGKEKVTFEIENLSNVSFINTDLAGVRFSDKARWGEKKVEYDKFWGGQKVKEDRFKIVDERLLEEKINKEKDDHTTKDFNLGSIKAVYRNLRENYEYRMRYDEAGQFFIREMELKRMYREVPSKEEDILEIKQNNWFRRNLFSLTGWYYHLSRYGESIWRPTLAGGVIVILSTLFWLMQSNPTVEPSLSTTECNSNVISDAARNNISRFIGLCEYGIRNNWLKAFERSLADFLPLLPTGDFKMGIIDFVIKIIGGAVTFGLIAIALRRRFERRYRH